MKYSKLCQQLATDLNRYRAMNEKRRKSFYGRFIERRIRKTTGTLKAFDKAMGVHHGPGGNYSPTQKPDK